MNFSADTLNKIHEVVRISDVVSKRVKLQHKGNNAFGLCPFHSEKSPSFSVNHAKNFYHCFGCGAHGDSIKFVQETQNLSFVEAVKSLAAEYNISIEQYSVDIIEKSKEAKILEINKLVSDWFHNNLFSKDNTHILEYLTKRGIDTNAINRFHLGYAPSNPKMLQQYLFSLGYSQLDVIESGIINEKYGDHVSRFRDRIMFPIKDAKARVIAFGGRVVSENALPKYLNSPETLVFKKRNALYLEDVALQNLKPSDSIFLVEGYIDAMSMHSAGFVNTVANLGTAISDSHLKKLWSKVYTPTICMDGDAAGLAAINKVTRVALPLLRPGYSLKFIRLPKGYDPDSLIKTHGSAYFKDLISKSINLSDMIWETEVNKINIELPENKALLKQTLLEIADTILDLEVRGFYKKYFLEKLNGLSDRYYTKKWKKFGKKDSKLNPDNVALLDKKLIERLSILERSEFALAAIIMNSPELLLDDVLYEKFTSITPKTKALDRTYMAILNSFAEMEAATEGSFSVEVFQNKVKNSVTEVFFNYLCGNSSCFIDTISIKTIDRAFELWLDTFERYNLELMKEEYKLLLQGFNSKNLEIAGNLKKEIENSENKIKTHAMNKDN
jgi:DNA primase catalytic core